MCITNLFRVRKVSDASETYLAMELMEAMEEILENVHLLQLLQLVFRLYIGKHLKITITPHCPHFMRELQIFYLKAVHI